MNIKDKILLENFKWEWDRKAHSYYLFLFAEIWSALKVSTLITFKNKNAVCYLDVKDRDRAGQSFVSRIESKKFFLGEWMKKIESISLELHNFCDDLDKSDFKKASNGEIIYFLKKLYVIYFKSSSNVGIIRNVNRPLQERILKICTNKNEAAMIFATSKKSFFQEEHENLLKIAEKYKKNPDSFERELEKHAKKYYYLPTGFYTEKIYVKKDFKTRLYHMIQAKEKPSVMRKMQIKEINKRTALIKKMRPSDSEKRILEFASICTYFKDYLRANQNRLHWNNLKLFQEVGRRTKNNYMDIAGLSCAEIVGILKARRKIKKRKSGVMYHDKQRMRALFNKDADYLMQKINSYFAVKPTQLIKGIIANPGKAQGKVVIAEKNSKIGKRGFVLVATMTTPDLMPLMRKSAAIITDEGGLTSHAAIVARELGKPCIIGTKFATKVLKDGDIIEVDANKGVVKILNK
jgi:phosphohistidine swiveling domain-containing protein